MNKKRRDMKPVVTGVNNPTEISVSVSRALGVTPLPRFVTVYNPLSDRTKTIMVPML